MKGQGVVPSMGSLPMLPGPSVEWADRAYAPERVTDRMQPIAVSVIVPTFNETDNLDELAERIGRALAGLSWELIIVDDDSPDGTAAHARRLHADNPRIRVIRRIGRRGLSSACIEGMLASSAPLLAVMDADLQHDPAVLADMIRLIMADGTDLVVASRYVEGGSLGGWGQDRAKVSRIATRLARSLTRIELSDPMSGFFMLRREVLDATAPRLSGIGFKILLDIVLSSPSELLVREVPLTFGTRRHGVSKLSVSVAWEYLLLLADKMIGHAVPVRFFAFACIGLLGVLIHLAILTFLYVGVGLSFVLGQSIATAVAMVGNFTVNNLLTYRDRSLRGWRWIGGLASFAAICGVGALANVGVANFLFGHHALWPVAACAGIIASAVWNYGVSARYTWGTAR